MKLIINKDRKCTKCDVFICCDGREENVPSSSHLFCYHCGEPIEWITERTVEEILDELMINTRLLGSRDIKDDLKETLEMTKTVDSLKQELLNKINK